MSWNRKYVPIWDLNRKWIKNCKQNKLDIKNMYTGSTHFYSLLLLACYVHIFYSGHHFFNISLKLYIMSNHQVMHSLHALKILLASSLPPMLFWHIVANFWQIFQVSGEGHFFLDCSFSNTTILILGSTFKLWNWTVSFISGHSNHFINGMHALKVKWKFVNN